jgi:hypothetical protein
MLRSSKRQLEKSASNPVVTKLGKPLLSESDGLFLSVWLPAPCCEASVGRIECEVNLHSQAQEHHKRENGDCPRQPNHVCGLLIADRLVPLSLALQATLYSSTHKNYRHVGAQSFTMSFP